MTEDRLAPYGTLLLRVTLGIVFLAHSVILKWQIYTLSGTAEFFASLGLPDWLAYVVFAAEAVGGVLLVLGIQTRWIALALIPILAGATWVHWGNGWLFTNDGGGWEYPFLLVILAVVQFLVGDGKYALVPSSDYRSLYRGQIASPAVHV